MGERSHGDTCASKPAKIQYAAEWNRARSRKKHGFTGNVCDCPFRNLTRQEAQPLQSVVHRQCTINALSHSRSLGSFVAQQKP